MQCHQLVKVVRWMGGRVIGCAAALSVLLDVIHSTEFVMQLLEYFV